MKPVFVENKIAKLKAIIHEVENGVEHPSGIASALDDIETDLTGMEDEKDSKFHLILLTVLLLPMGAYLLYNGFYWPSLLLVSWLGAILYYRTNEKSLDIDRLTERAKITPHDQGTKINYLLSSIHQKQGRLSLIRNLNILFWPFVVFMGQLLLNESVPTFALWIILIVIGIINAFFWIRHFAPLQTALDGLETDLNSLNSNLILANNEADANIILYADEEE